MVLIVYFRRRVKSGKKLTKDDTDESVEELCDDTDDKVNTNTNNTSTPAKDDQDNTANVQMTSAR